MVSISRLRKKQHIPLSVVNTKSNSQVCFAFCSAFLHVHVWVQAQTHTVEFRSAHTVSKRQFFLLTVNVTGLEKL
jgi:hypothetical protein